jgi:Ala-tRNA(Pro) deacylase
LYVLHKGCLGKEARMSQLTTKQCLDDFGITYVCTGDSPLDNAQDLAGLAHITGVEMAKTVMLKLDGETAMAVVPASLQVDCALLKSATGAVDVELAGEDEFPDWAPGAMPPLGDLCEMEVIVADCLADKNVIAFNAGCYGEVLKLAYQDFACVLQPTVARIAC